MMKISCRSYRIFMRHILSALSLSGKRGKYAPCPVRRVLCVIGAFRGLFGRKESGAAALRAVPQAGNSFAAFIYIGIFRHRPSFGCFESRIQRARPRLYREAMVCEIPGEIRRRQSNQKPGTAKRKMFPAPFLFENVFFLSTGALYLLLRCIFVCFMTRFFIGKIFPGPEISLILILNSSAKLKHFNVRHNLRFPNGDGFC